MFQAIEANPASSTRTVSGEHGISVSSVLYYLHNLGKIVYALRYQNIAKLLIHPSIIGIMLNHF